MAVSQGSIHFMGEGDYLTAYVPTNGVSAFYKLFDGTERLLVFKQAERVRDALKKKP